MPPRPGFTIIELVLVIGIISLLAATVIVAMTPGKEMREARNTLRENDIQSILTATYEYAIDHDGNFPAGIALEAATEICVTGSTDCDAGGVNLDVLTGVLGKIPSDPQATGTGTEYYISRDASGHLTVSAPLAEGGEEISVTR